MWGGAIDVDEVFPLAVADGEVGVVFIIAMTEAGAVGWATPEDGGLAGGCGFAEKGLGEVFAIEFFGGLGVGDLVEGAVEVEGAEDGGVIGSAF